ncbi:MAG: MarR family transcriptional regulator [Dehalococcoidia bacterium]|nr:MarR family transcriptional regulator [Dehalococcoidia bacterium]
MGNEKPSAYPYKLWQLLRIARAFGMEMRNHELKDLGITRCQATLFLAMRSAGEKATIADLARWTGQQPHGVSALVSRLEAQGYVNRVRDLERKNLVRVELTEKGKVAYEAARQRDSINTFFGSLTEEQQHCLGEGLEALIDCAAKELRVKKPPCMMQE